MVRRSWPALLLAALLLVGGVFAALVGTGLLGASATPSGYVSPSSIATAPSNTSTSRAPASRASAAGPVRTRSSSPSPSSPAPQSSSSSARPTPRTSPQSTAPSPTAAAPRLSSTAAPEGSPVHVRVASAAGRDLVEAPLQPAYLNRDQALEPVAGRAGWYAEAGWPRPGFPGSSIVVGHVSWNGVPDVFWNLPRVRPGDRVTVDYSSGDRVRFVVTRSAALSKKAVPQDHSIWQPGARQPEIRLITCDPATPVVGGHFVGNWVVWGARD